MGDRPPPVPLLAGLVGRPHGLGGAFHVRRPRSPLLIAGAEVEVAGVARRIAHRGGTDAAPVVRLAGVDSRQAAAELVGSEIRVARGAAPALGPDEWYPEELEGCAVSDGPRELGTVRRLLALPSCEVLEVVGSEGVELLVPLIRDAVRTVDVAARRIDVDAAFLGAD